LTSEDLEAGLSFREACATLEQQHRARSRSWASWGDYDRKQFEHQCRAEQVPYPFSQRHTNAKTAFSRAEALPRKLGMKDALEYAGLPLEGHHHRGDDDAWNIAALVLRMLQHGAWPT